jgi:chaperonin GroEL
VTTTLRYGTPARAALLRGIARMTALLRPTLGPLPRTVAITHLSSRQKPPEILDSAATIARRTLQFADPFENMGGMLVRHLVWRVFDQSGDGGATAAVLAHALVREGARAIAAGASPVLVRSGFERALGAATEALREQARPLDGASEIARTVLRSVHDPDLAELIGEIVDSVGPDGAIIVEDAAGTMTSHEYLDGVRWNEGFFSTFLLKADEATAGKLLDPRILVTDHVLDRAEQLLPVLEACAAAGQRSLLVVAPEMRDAAIGMLVANRERGVLDGALAVKTPSYGEQRAGILEDLAAITGGRCILTARGDRLDDVTIADLGAARHAWATRLAFGILGGQGSKAAIHSRLGEVKAELRLAGNADVYTKRILRERVGKLAGLAAIIHVGAHSQTEQEERRLRVEAAIKSARLALEHGVVPGGGAALLACSRAVSCLPVSGYDEQLAVAALGRALAEPMRTILRNAGLEAEPVLARFRSNPEFVFDAVSESWVDPFASGLVDPLQVVQCALETSVSAAMTTLTAEVLVHRTNAPTSVEP